MLQKNEREYLPAAVAAPILRDFTTTWLTDLVLADHAARTVRRYRQIVQHFLAWYAQQEHRPITPADCTPIAFGTYRQHLQRTMATATVNEGWQRFATDSRQIRQLDNNESYSSGIGLIMGLS